MDTTASSPSAPSAPPVSVVTSKTKPRKWVVEGIDDKAPEDASVNVLALDYSTNWAPIFKGKKTVAGDDIKLEQVEWKDLHVEASSSEATIVHLKAATNPLPFSNQKEDRTFKPDFIIFRNFPTDIHDNSFRNVVMGLCFNNIPGINSPSSILQTMDRAMVYAGMLRLHKKHGPKFPIVPMQFYPNVKASTVNLMKRDFPMVIKVGSTHAGYGKIIAKNKGELDDVKCVLAMHNDFFTMEPFVEHEYEFRVQKIGKHYRAFRRNSDTSWKNNWGELQFVDHPMEDIYKFWVDECATLFGGLDMLAIDVLHKKDGTDVILEINDTAFGLMWEHEEEDVGYIAELAMERINETYPKKKAHSKW